MEQCCFLGQGLLALGSEEGGMGQEYTELSGIRVLAVPLAGFVTLRLSFSSLALTFLSEA